MPALVPAKLQMFAVFEQAAAGVEAAVAIQRSVLGRSWPDHLPVRIRIGLHAGRPTLTDTGYLGLAVHAAARICFASHGGQILLSRAVVDAVAGSASAGIRFKDLGQHRFHGQRDDVFFESAIARLQCRVDQSSVPQGDRWAR